MNILLTSAGRRAYLVRYFKEALASSGKVYASNSHYTLALKDADDYMITPLIYEEGYIPSIISYCKSKKIDAVVSLFDIDLLVLSKHESEFKNNGIDLILAPFNSVEICNDKWKTYLFLESNGINTPRTFLSIDNVTKSLNDGEISYPLIIKPRWGMASLSTYLAENEKELTVFYEKVKREIGKSYLKYESSFTPDNAIVIQEVALGQEYGIDVLNDLDSQFFGAYAKEKTVMRSGETDIGKIVSIKPFIGLSKKLSELIQHRGILSVDCFFDGQSLQVLEMNCRISGHYPLTHLAGLNVPELYVKWLNNETVDANQFSVEEGLVITKDLVPRRLD